MSVTSPTATLQHLERQKRCHVDDAPIGSRGAHVDEHCGDEDEQSRRRSQDSAFDFDYHRPLSLAHFPSFPSSSALVSFFWPPSSHPRHRPCLAASACAGRPLRLAVIILLLRKGFLIRDTTTSMPMNAEKLPPEASGRAARPMPLAVLTSPRESGSSSLSS